MENKIGIDFHGVISATPENFAVFCREIRKYGILVYVISGGPEKDVAHYLDEHKIEYDKVWAILDFYEAKGQAVCYDDGSFAVPTDLWNRAKAEYCAEEGVNFHIDDSSVYGKYFVTPYCRYDMSNDVCELNTGFEVDFKQPHDAARKVAEFIKSN